MSFFDMLSNAFGGGDSQQSEYIKQLQQIVSGQGPNPAQQMLTQQTQNNNAMAQGQIAGAAGLSPALAARTIINQQRANQQQAAGQGATLQAQQSLGALGAEGTAIQQQRQDDTSFITALTGAIASGVGGAAGMGSMGGGGSSSAGAGTGIGGSGSAMSNAVGNAFSGTGNSLSGFVMPPPPIFSSGGEVPGRAEENGDSPANDKVPAMLSPGEVVVPRSVMQSDDAPARAAAFVEAIKAHHMKDKKKPTSYADVVAARRRAREAA